MYYSRSYGTFREPINPSIFIAPNTLSHLHHSIEFATAGPLLSNQSSSSSSSSSSLNGRSGVYIRVREDVDFADGWQESTPDQAIIERPITETQEISFQEATYDLQ